MNVLQISMMLDIGSGINSQQDVEFQSVEGKGCGLCSGLVEAAFIALPPTPPKKPQMFYEHPFLVS